MVWQDLRQKAFRQDTFDTVLARDYTPALIFWSLEDWQFVFMFDTDYDLKAMDRSKSCQLIWTIFLY